MPSPLSVTAANVPWAVPFPSPKVTVEPPVVNAVPAESRAVNVTVAVPLTAMEAGATATVDWAGSAGPGPAVTVMVGAVEVTA